MENSNLIRLSLSKDHNPNYLCTLVKIETLRKHPNADRLQLAEVFGTDVIVDSSTKIGDVMLHFPIECCISEVFLLSHMLYREKILCEKLGVETVEKSGFFEEKGRVKATKLRGLVSNGFLMPVSSLEKTFGKDVAALEINTRFDTVEDNLLLWKYEKPVGRMRSGTQRQRKKNISELFIEGQWRFHYDTEKYENNFEEINDFLPRAESIVISQKLHGTSICLGNILVKKSKYKFLNWLYKIFTKSDSEYRDVWSSRTVIKTPLYKTNRQKYYEDDIWDKVYEQCFAGKIPNGVSIYAEVVGYTQSGGFIQKGFDYGTQQPENGEYLPDVNYKVFVYRITETDSQGVVRELPLLDLETKLHELGLNNMQVVPILKVLSVAEITGKDAKMLIPSDRFEDDKPAENLFHWIKKDPDGLFNMEKDSRWCKHKVPEEGVVVRIDHRAWKIKCNDFLVWESKDLDS
ncbi:MAG: hypothetical protein LBR67_08980 [Dysgonamonadaceae bacterium]|jgi:tRNA-binding EMAP/Myf-like protein|nr:hypothetical protein [Dysgonamonadaceae bacterium]